MLSVHFIHISPIYRPYIAHISPIYRPYIAHISPISPIAHAFVQTPIYDETSGDRIGYKVSDDYVQQVSPDVYIIRLQNTYYFENRGSISWNYVFKNNTNSFFYPPNVHAFSRPFPP